jgi:hypothetical protein
MLNPVPFWRYSGSYEVEAGRNDRRAEGRRALQDRHEKDYLGPSLRDCAARRRVQKAVHAQSSKARPKTEAEIRFPRPCRRRLEWRREVLALASQSLGGEALAHDLRNRQFEAVTVVHLFPIVVAEQLLIDIPKQMERLDTDRGAVQAEFQETPEVLDSIGVDIAVDVLDSVIDDDVVIVVFDRPS